MATDTDLDGDGILNVNDAFALDATNGLGTVIDADSPWVIDFMSLGAASPLLPVYETGLSGAMTVPGAVAGSFDDAPMGVALSAAGLTVQAVAPGDAYQNKNALTHGYQFGVDVSSMAAFVAGTRIVNPFQTAAPQNYQAQGLQIGTGSQNEYIKLALVAKGGAGGIEVLWESGGNILFRQAYTLDFAPGATLANVATVELDLRIDRIGGDTFVTPNWRLFSATGQVLDDQRDDGVQPFSVTGAIAQAIDGTHAVGGLASGLAVGLYGTSADAAPFEATWQTIGVKAAPQVTDVDLDGDGILNGADAFALDASNGADFVVDETSGFTLNFVALGDASGNPLTPFEAGMTGVGLVPNATSNLLNLNPASVAVTDIGLTVSSVAGGDSYKAKNSLANGYQFGVDVSAMPAFSVHALMVNPFKGFIPQNYQAQGLQVGAGDQNNYIKAALVANGGLGGIEFLWESDGAIIYRKLFGLDLPSGTALSNVASIDIGLQVDSGSGTTLVAPTWRLLAANGGVIADQTQAPVVPITVTGAVAEAIAGDYLLGGVESNLAVGLYATSSGAAPFNATWKSIEVASSTGLDYDSDGILNGFDPFAIDAANGLSNVVDEASAFHLDFGAAAAAAGGTLSPHEAGLSGVIRNPGSLDNTFTYLPSTAIVTATGLTVAAVSAGDAYQSQNALQDGYQVGIDVSAAPAFVARTTILNPFRDAAPVDYQAQGFQIGTGNQDEYIKLAFVSKGGAGGIEVLWEDGGAVAFRQSFTLDLPSGITLADVARVELSLNVDSSTGETVVTPNWRLLGDAGGLIDSGNDDAVIPFTVTGAVADAIAGTYEIGGVPVALAAGLYATSSGATPFDATWQSIDVQYSEPFVPDYAFSQLALTGTNGLANPTSLEFGPDGRLYVAERFGGIWSYEVEKTTSGYNVTDAQYIDLIKNMPNHDDSGSVTTVLGRQTTGLLMAGTEENPIIYVSSSNPVVGGGPGGLDKDLDTNSGILSRLTWTGTEWDKVDLVRGFPRSEENHSVNGMILEGDSLYLTVAGNTNQGSPSSKFAGLSEYALASSVLKIDLAALDAMPVNDVGTANPWVYDLPTLDDPTVANVDTDGDGTPDDDPNGVFGGNDGLNMAKFDPNGPIEIFATGYRNPYDIVKTVDGHIYVTDNGGNATWGGVPLYDSNGLATNNPNPDENSVSMDSLHLVSEGGHGGHANPTRGNTAGAGLSLDSGWTNDPAQLPVDWLERNGGVEFLNDNISARAIVDGEGRPIPGAVGSDGSLWGFTASTNGLAEYTASAFDGALQGYLITASYDGRIALLERDPSGTQVVDVDYLQILLGNTVPLDVTAQGDADPFAGTVWVANIGSSQIVVLEPTDPGNIVIDPTIASDADQDGIANINDAFYRDPLNGMGTTFGAGDTIVWDFARDASNPPPLGGVSIFGLGFTGVMYNGLVQPGALYDPDNILPSGANPVFQVNYVSEGEAHAGHNSQESGFQFGVNFDETVALARISSTIDNPFDSTTPEKYQSQGIFIGTGSQSDYISIGVAQHQGGSVEIKQEVDDVVIYKKIYAASGLFDSTDVVLNFDVDAVTGAVRPFWSYTLNGQEVVGGGEQFLAQGDTLKAILGTYSQDKNIPGFSGEIASGLAIGIHSTSVGPAEEFTASWADITVETFAAPPPPSAFFGITLKNVIDTSTFTGSSFELVNLPESGAGLVSMTIDTSTAVLPQIVFDPFGTAGDTGSPKAFTIDSQIGTFGSSATYGAAIDGGFQTMQIDFDGLDPGESLKFSIDVDPSNIKGASPPGPRDTGSISGLEMVGSTVTLTYADGTVQTTQIFKDPGKLAGASAVFQDEMPSAPVVDIDGFNWGDTSAVANRTVDVTGTPGSTVRVVVAEGGLYLDGVAPDAPPAEGANTFLAVRQYNVAIGTDGHGEVEILLTDADGTGGSATGRNYVFAAELDTDGLYNGALHYGPASQGFLVQYSSDDLLLI